MNFDFVAQREKHNALQAQLDSIKAKHGKSHPSLDKLQGELDERLAEINQIERDYNDYQSKLQADIQSAVDQAKDVTLAESKKRCEGIVAAMNKRGGDSEVQALGMQALRDPDCSVADFKLNLIHLLENRQGSKPT
jgi:chromosome segregation ATPase